MAATISCGPHPNLRVSTAGVRGPPCSHGETEYAAITPDRRGLALNHWSIMADNGDYRPRGCVDPGFLGRCLLNSQYF
jgi:hypothetical protein